MFLAAVQTRLQVEPYRSAGAFSDWVLAQARAALRERDPAEPAVVGFPELVGLGLLLFLGRPDDGARTVVEAAVSLAREGWREAMLAGLRHGNLGLSALVLPRARRVHEAYLGAFARVARELDVTVVAGTAFLPTVELEAALGVHVAGGRVRNVAYTLAPGGTLVARTPKLNLTAGLERRLGLARGRPEEVLAPLTPAGRVVALVCYDAFFETLLERADALGAGVLVQPSANARAWDGPWSADASLVEGTEWVARGPLARLGGRANLRYVVNPMLVGSLLDLRFEGRSAIAANRALEPGVADRALVPGGRGVIASAGSATDFEVVTARVPRPGLAS